MLKSAHMVENPVPGSQDATYNREIFFHGTPTVPLKNYARGMMQEEGTDPKLAKSIVEFIEAAYWIENKIGDPEKHQSIAMSRARRLGLSDQDIATASQSAGAIYADYKKLAGIDQDAPLTRSAIAAAEARKRRPIVEAKAKREARVKLKKELEQRYRNLTSYSDTKLQVANSNQRVSLDEDPIYTNSGRTIKERMKNRELSEGQYQQAKEKDMLRSEMTEDPYQRVAGVLSLAESKSPQSIIKLVRLLNSNDPLIRDAAADVLDQTNWLPKTPTERTFYFAARGEWDKVMILDEDALPALLILSRNRDIVIRDRAVDILDQHDWQLDDLPSHDQARYHLIRREWAKFYHLLNKDDELLAVARDFLRVGESVTRRYICLILEKKDTPSALQILSRLKKDEDGDVRYVANNASVRLSENPFYLQKITGSLGDIKVPIVRAILSVHPEWEGKSVSKEDVDTFAKAIPYLPPVGGKISVGRERRTRSSRPSYPTKLDPSMIVEEQIKLLAEKRQRKELGDFYVHQLTVQGRLPDEFKYVALALILSSPYTNDWSKPFFTAHWGHVAPLVHDGGNVETNLNPLWRDVDGRIDFLQRVVVVHKTNLEEMEQLTSEEKNKYPVDALAEARAEQEERDRLILEGKAYQRLALALHAKTETAPKVIPIDIRDNLSTLWQNFRNKMNLLLGEYGIKGAADVTWFNETPQMLDGWSGLRHEAEWKPIRKELEHLEEVSKNYQSLNEQVKQILQHSVEDIDREIGLLPKN